MEEKYFTDSDLKLSTYAKRIRHIKGLCIKNLSYKCADINHLEVYFSLHRNATSAHFYKSESVRGTVNAGWRSIDIRHVPWYYTAPSQVCLRIWVKDGDSLPKVHLEFDLDLQMLILSSAQTTARVADSCGETTPSDLLTVEMFGSTFGLPSSIQRDEFLYISTEQTPKVSYSTNQLSRLQTVLRALRQTEQQMSRVKEGIHEQMVERKSMTHMLEQVEASRVRVSSIRSKLEQRRRVLQTKRSRVAVRRVETSKREKEMDYSQKMMQEDDGRFADVKSDYYNARERLLKGNALLSQRQKQLVHELSLIYPIEQMIDGRYTIAGVFLPNAEQVSSQNELASSTSQGYTAHLVSMLSHFLQLPLEYPINFQGSRSLIYDMARPTPLLPSQKDRSLPLYSRGKDKKLFVYAAQLLNKNIENLRHAYELPTKDPKLTLRNLKDFLHCKFDVGVVSQPQQESCSPPAALLRATSITHLRHPSLATLGRSQTMTTDWSNTTSNYPNDEYSSDETHSKPSEPLAHSFYRNSSPLTLPNEHIPPNQQGDSPLPTIPLLKKSISFDSIKHNGSGSLSDSSQRDACLKYEKVEEVEQKVSNDSLKLLSDNERQVSADNNNHQKTLESSLHTVCEDRGESTDNNKKGLDSNSSPKVTDCNDPFVAGDTCQQVNTGSCQEATSVNNANVTNEDGKLVSFSDAPDRSDYDNTQKVLASHSSTSATHSRNTDQVDSIIKNVSTNDSPADCQSPHNILDANISQTTSTCAAMPKQLSTSDRAIDEKHGLTVEDIEDASQEAVHNESEHVNGESNVGLCNNSGIVEPISESADDRNEQLADSIKTRSETNGSTLTDSITL
ncbi:uncharacterized protein [Watersipora subatra]|uniref:uncharacterized protein n=1 Tax=Watersipora subatra TaxID=2589382 RepID=UPI00355AE092